MQGKYYLYTNNAYTQGAVLTPTNAAFTLVCYVTGTRILTERGEVPVETLAIGDRVVTSSGAHRPIRWLGHRTLDCRDRTRPGEIMPVRIAAHALGPNRPARDLHVSPGHSLCFDLVGEVLIPANMLINGTTIQQVSVDEVTYWHVELDSHDILVAENLPAESYIDMNNRGFFAESAVVDLDASPDAPAHTTADFCRPFHVEGPLVEAVRLQLRHQARAQGWTLDDSDPFAGLHLLIDGIRVEPVTRGLVARFAVPAGAREVWLVSSTTRPCDVSGSPDVRDIGVLVGAISIDDGFGALRPVDLSDSLLGIGFHEPEDGVCRWTAGRARLPSALWQDVSDGFFLRVELGVPALPRWISPKAIVDEDLDAPPQVRRLSSVH